MRVLLDTSVLVPALVETHKHHKQAMPWLKKVYDKEVDLIISGHSLLELFAVLTRLPLTPRISGATATYLIMEAIEQHAEIILLDVIEYKEILKEMVTLGFSGGVIYDAVILKAAEKAGAEAVITFNMKDFKRLRPKDTDWIRVP